MGSSVYHDFNDGFLGRPPVQSNLSILESNESSPEISAEIISLERALREENE